MNSGVSDTEREAAVKILSKVYYDGCNIRSTIRDLIEPKFAEQFGFDSVEAWRDYKRQFNTDKELFDSFTTPALLDAINKFGYSRNMKYRNLGF